jgi:hypothetical protein
MDNGKHPSASDDGSISQVRIGTVSAREHLRGVFGTLVSRRGYYLDHFYRNLQLFFFCPT